MDLNEQLLPENLYWRSQMNATTLIVASIVLLKERGMVVEDWFVALRQLNVASWNVLQGAGAKEVVTQVVLNPVSVGATLVAITGDDACAEAVIADWPPREVLDTLRLTLDDMTPFWNALRVMPEHLGFQFTWERSDEQVTLRLVRRPDTALP